MNSRRTLHVARRALAFFVAWICVPCLIILALECLLWAMDYGRNTEPFILIGQEPDLAYKHNPFFTLRFTNNDDSHETVDSSFTAIPAKKGANTYRMFVLGSSAAQGFPYDCSFARMLQVLLTTRYPGVRFEIFILANAGMNSHIMRNLAEVCSHMNPDAFIVYMGNNEVHGPYGLIHAEGNHIGRVLTPTEIKLNMWFRGTRLWQFGRATVFGRWTIEKSAHRSAAFVFNNDPRLAHIWRNYHANLSAIFHSANAVEADVFIATLGVNQRHWPSEVNIFQSAISDDYYVQWNDLLIAGKKAAANQHWEEALNIFRKAESINSSNPELAFNMANCFYALARYEEAREYYNQAVELDGFFWVRAKGAVNDTLRSAVDNAQFNSVHLVEGRAALEAASPHGITGSDLFASGCHLRPKGAYVLAKAFFDRMTSELPEWVTQKGALHVDLPGWEECMLILGMAPNLQRRVLNEVIRQREERGAPIEEELKQELLRAEDYARFFNDEGRLPQLSRFIEQGSDDYFIAGQYLSIIMRNTHMITPEMAPLIHRLAENHPCNRNIQYFYTLFLFHMDMLEEGMAAFQRLIRLYPSDYEAYLAVVEMFIDRDRPDMAIAVLKKARRNQMPQYLYYCLMGDILSEQNKDEAIANFLKSLDIVCRQYQAFEGLIACVESLGNQSAVHREPIIAKTHDWLARGGDWRLISALLVALGAYDETSHLYERLAQLGADPTEIQLYLGMLKIRMGNVDTGISHIQDALARDISLRPQAEKMIAELIHHGGDSSPALEETLLRAMVSLESTNTHNLEQLGRVFEERGDYEEAESMYTQALSIQPESWHAARRLFAIHNSLGAHNISWWINLSEQFPNASAPRLYLGLALESSGREEEAHARYREAFSASQNNALALLEIGRALLDTSAVSLGEEAIERALSLQPSHAQEAAIIYDEFAKRQKEKGLLMDAVNWQHRAVRRNPTDLRYQIQLAQLYEGAALLMQAIETYRGILLQAPELPFAVYSMDALFIQEAMAPERIDTWRDIAEKNPDAITPQLRLSMALFDVGDFEESYRIAASLAGKAADNQDVLFHLGKVLLFVNDIDAGLDQLKRIAAHDERLVADVSAVIARRAQVALTANDLDLAERLYRAAVEHSPAEAQYKIALGELLESLGRAPEALELYQELMWDAPESSYIAGKLDALYDNQEDKGGRVSFWRRLSEQVSDAIEPSVRLCMALLDTEEYEAALERLRLLATKAPDNEQVLFLSGKALLFVGDVDAGLAQLASAVSRNGHLSSSAGIAIAQCAEIALAANNHPLAEKLYRAALEQAPADLWHMVALGELLESLGRDMEALELYQEILRIAPESPHTADNLDKLYARRGNVHDRVTFWREQCRLFPAGIEPALRLGMALHDAEDYAGSFEILQRLAIKTPDKDRVLFSLARARLFIGDIASGVEQLASVAAHNEHLASIAGAAIANRAEIALKEEDHPLAERLYRAAIEIAPGDLWHKVALGDLLESLGRDMEALELYQEIVRIAPESPLSAEKLDAIFTRNTLQEERMLFWQSVVDAHPNAETPKRHLRKLVEHDGKTWEPHAPKPDPVF